VPVDAIQLQNRISLQLTGAFPPMPHNLAWYLAGEVVREVVLPIIDQLEEEQHSGDQD
jgi:hypothetical protein